MTELVELTPSKHAALRVVYNSALELAKKQHTINVRVTEVGQAVSSFPIFMTRVESSGGWVLSAIMALETGINLFVEDGEWQATYRPTAMQTYPFQLIKSPRDEKNYTIGIDEQSTAFSEEDGEALFDEENKASLYLSRVSALLEANIKNDIQTYEFTQKIEDLGLVKAIDVLVEYDNGATNTLKGLHTLDEEKLKSLSSEHFVELRNKGYLAPMYAMLTSVFQLNLLLRKHNELDSSSKVKQIRMDPAKDYANLS